ncbi:DUF7661 family protein [Alteromonas sp. ASW11-130]|uniref:DUF7661 family protein n=1 Tax=Alteromonas sp. ASW11-130 TaxID=3015775 RepID=UPI003FA43222
MEGGHYIGFHFSTNVTHLPVYVVVIPSELTPAEFTHFFEDIFHEPTSEHHPLVSALWGRYRFVLPYEYQ